MVGKSNIIPRGTGKKHWRMRIKTTFDIPMKRLKRKRLRQKKAAAVFPRPVKKLYPVVRCNQSRFNMKLRRGKGFSIQECKAAGIKVPYARTIGVSVDLRRKNRNEEEFRRNVDILSDYYGRMRLVPTDPKKQIEGVVLQKFYADNTLQREQPSIQQTEFVKDVEYRTITEADLNKKTATNKMLYELKKSRKLSYDLMKAKKPKKKGKKQKKKKGKKQ